MPVKTKNSQNQEPIEDNITHVARTPRVKLKNFFFESTSSLKMVPPR